MIEQTLTDKPVDLPRRGLTLSDCVGIVIGCALLMGVLKMNGPVPWITRQRPLGLQIAATALHVGSSICVFGLAAGPPVMIPRAVRWGWRSLTVTECAWLVFGIGFCLIILCVRMLPEVGEDAHWRRGLLLAVMLTAFVVWFGDFVVRTAAPRRIPQERCATGWTHRFSQGLWVIAVATAALLWFFALRS